jgi:ADP-glucose pyrophosphorylase
VNSVLSPGVRVEVGAVVRDSIVMFDSVIRSGAVVDRAILDKEVVVGPGSIIGEGVDLTTPNRQEPARLFTGITVVGKRAIIPRGVRIGRNVKIGGDVRTSDFVTRVVRSGATVERRDDAAQRRRASTTLNGDAPPAAGSGGSAGSLRSGTVGPSPVRQSADAQSGGQRRPD